MNCNSNSIIIIRAARGGRMGLLRSEAGERNMLSTESNIICCLLSLACSLFKRSIICRWKIALSKCDVCLCQQWYRISTGAASAARVQGLRPARMICLFSVVWIYKQNKVVSYSVVYMCVCPARMKCSRVRAARDHWRNVGVCIQKLSGYRGGKWGVGFRL